MAISRQNNRSTSRRSDGFPGDFIGALPVNSVIHPAGLPISTSTIVVLRRPVEPALGAAVVAVPFDAPTSLLVTAVAVIYTEYEGLATVHEIFLAVVTSGTFPGFDMALNFTTSIVSIGSGDSQTVQVSMFDSTAKEGNVDSSFMLVLSCPA